MWRGGCLTIKLAMADRDVIEQARIWTGHTEYITNLGRVGKVTEYQPKRGRRLYSFTIHGHRAAGWMMMLYQFMGARRRGQIRDALGRWRAGEIASSLKTHCRAGHLLDGRRASGRRFCTICKNISQNRDYYTRRSALRVIDGAH